MSQSSTASNTLVYSGDNLYSAFALWGLLYIQGKDLDEQVDATLDRLLVEFGKEILEIIPGKVSTEVDARFSFDTKASIEKALHIIDVPQQSFHATSHILMCIAIQINRYRQRAHPHQDCLDMGGHQSSSCLAVRARNQL